MDETVPVVDVLLAPLHPSPFVPTVPPGAMPRFEASNMTDGSSYQRRTRRPEGKVVFVGKAAWTSTKLTRGARRASPIVGAIIHTTVVVRRK